MATQAWQMPDVDAEKYQSVTKLIFVFIEEIRQN